MRNKQKSGTAAIYEHHISASFYFYLHFLAAILSKLQVVKTQRMRDSQQSRSVPCTFVDVLVTLSFIIECVSDFPGNLGVSFKCSTFYVLFSIWLKRCLLKENRRLVKQSSSTISKGTNFSLESATNNWRKMLVGEHKRGQSFR